MQKAVSRTSRKTRGKDGTTIYPNARNSKVIPPVQLWTDALSEEYRRKHYRLVIARAAQLFNYDSSNPDWLLLTGLSWFRLGAPVVATRFLERAVSVNPDLKQSWLRLAELYEIIGDRPKMDHARIAFQKAKDQSFLLGADSEPLDKRYLLGLIEKLGLIGQQLGHKALMKNCSLPEAVAIETSSRCNRACSYCPNSTMDRAEMLMSEDLFKQIIESLVTINYSNALMPVFYGEPLLDNRLERLLSYARKKLPHVYIMLVTNGDFLTTERWKTLTAAGVNDFHVSLHAKSIPRHLKAIRELARSADNGRVFLNHFYKLHKNQNDKPVLMNRGGLISVPTRPRLTCYKTPPELIITATGALALCCNDFHATTLELNLNKSDLWQLWFDPQYVSYRENIAVGVWPFDLCRKCTRTDGFLTSSTSPLRSSPGA